MAFKELLDGLTWEPLPVPERVDDGLPYATHQGLLAIADIELRVYQLSSGDRVIDGDDFERAFGLQP